MVHEISHQFVCVVFFCHKAKPHFTHSFSLLSVVFHTFCVNSVTVGRYNEDGQSFRLYGQVQGQQMAGITIGNRNYD